MPKLNKKKNTFRRNPRKLMNVDPPQLKTGIQFSHTFRYYAASAGTAAISPMVAHNLLCVATATGTAYTIVKSLRLDRVAIWGYTSGYITLTPSDGTDVTNARRTIHDVCRDPSRPAHIVWSPRSTDNGFRSYAETDTWCSLVLNIGDIVDITFTVVLDGEGTAQSISVGTSGLTTGTLYYGSPDGDRSTAKLFSLGAKNW